ncbi:hypothetical protein MMC28_011305 [Mycoblastus sanguinarius]|nr:hypothetical protein [Mycoblastus sanguinarius]
MSNQNVFTLAADDSPSLLPLLRSNPTLASSQDDSGYSLPHAAASYNHIDLLRTLVHEFHADPNIKDLDGETPLFVVETVAAAQALIEELGADPAIKSKEGLTAEEKIQFDGENTAISDFLRESRLRGISSGIPASNGTQYTSLNDDAGHPPPLPPNVKVHFGTMEDEQALGKAEADPKFRKRIEELAARDDFQGEEGQKQLRELITDAIRGTGDNERSVKQRLE